MVTNAKDWFMFTIRMISFCLGFFIVLDYIFTCNVETRKGHLFMLSGIFLTIVLFVIYRWSDLFTSSTIPSNSYNMNIPANTTSVDILM